MFIMKEKITKIVKIDFIRFSIVGGLGFLINLILLTLLHRQLDVDIFLAQLISAEIALFSNFLLHNHWTYAHHKVDKSKTNLLIRFHLTSWPAILGSTLMVGLFEKLAHFGNLLSLSISSVIILGWNFFWSKYFVWKDVNINKIEGDIE